MAEIIGRLVANGKDCCYFCVMHPKFIIVSQPKETRGFLRMGMVCNHRDLIEGYEKELQDYTFYFTPIAGLPGNPLDTSSVEWV